MWIAVHLTEQQGYFPVPVHRIAIAVFVSWVSVLLHSCKKDPPLPTEYHFRIVDQYTKQPLTGVTVTKLVVGRGVETQVMGTTGPEGIFHFTYSAPPYQGADTRFVFEHPEYFYEAYARVRPGLGEQHLDIELYGRSTLAIVIRRLTPLVGCPPESMQLWYQVSGVYPCVSCYADLEAPDDNVVQYRYFDVPAVYPKTIRYGTRQSSACTDLFVGPTITQEVMTGHFDTTYFAIDY